MIRKGFTIESPLTGSRTVVLESDLETNGMGWLLEIHCPPRSMPDIGEHLHTHWTETFEIVSGTAYYKLDGKRHKAETGQTIVMPPGQLQVHPWNMGKTEMVYRQRTEFERPTPQAVQDVLGVFATLAGLARDGKVGSNGLPRDGLQLAATLRTLGQYGGYDASLPIPAQKLLAATLGNLAHALGYRAVYPKYVGEEI